MQLQVIPFRLETVECRKYSANQYKTYTKENIKHMSHGIEQPWDMVDSIEGTEWHSMANHRQLIDREVAKRHFFQIIESPALVYVDDRQINLDKYKVLLADHRACRDDLDVADQIVPLHIPKNGYTPISNESVWDTLQDAIKDLGARITSICTLERGKKFAVSVELEGSDMEIKIKNRGKEKFKAFLNFVTSHDGTIAMNIFDSIIRIICMNTLRWSMEAMGDVRFKVYHTKNASLAMDNLGELVNAILKGRANLAEVMEYLSSCKVDNNEAIAMAMGYFAKSTGTVELSTRAINAANEITLLFARGVGNTGETLYDLANGATEFWTHGNGTGRSLSQGNRVYRSAMGSAADHKQAFVAMLANENSRKEMLTLGREALLAAK